MKIVWNDPDPIEGSEAEVDSGRIGDSGMKHTKHNYTIDLNELGCPIDDLKSEGGRIPDYCKYGSWLRRNDPIAFEVGYRDWVQELF